MISYERLTKGLLGSNTYVVWSDSAADAAIIDTGNDLECVEEIVSRRGLSVRYIILTHGHYDHIYFLNEYREFFKGAECVIHEEDNKILGDARLNASSFFGPEHVYPKADHIVHEGDKLMLGTDEIEILHTPGHTMGGISIKAGDYIFTGDTLFYGGFGRTDLGAGSTELLAKSIERLYALSDDLIVLPGHGTKSTIGRERRENPFMDF